MEQISQYKILKKLGSGGFGEVWLGENAIRQVAIKVFKPKEDNLASFVGESGSDSQALPILQERFLNEAKILADLEANPHIISVYEFGELEDGSPYYVMPFLPRSLADLLGKDIYDAAAIAELDEADRPRALPLNDALRYLEQLLIGLSAAHDRGLIHRDIKPSNVMLTEDDQIRLVDFGIAKAPDSQHSVSQVGMGSQKYMAPEQRESAKHVDARADVYSVGVMAYRMITGRLPGMPFRDPNVLVLELNQTINDLIVSCLSDSKSDRLPDAGSLLTRFQAGKQTSTNDEDYSGTWVGDSGKAQIRDELLPLKQEIERIIEAEVDVSETARRGLRLMASVVDLNENGLDDLIEQIEISHGQALKLKRNFLRVVDDMLKTHGELTEADRDALYKSAAPLNLPKSDVMRMINIAEVRTTGRTQDFVTLVERTLREHGQLSEADRGMLYRAGDSLALAKSELMKLISETEQRVSALSGSNSDRESPPKNRKDTEVKDKTSSGEGAAQSKPKRKQQAQPRELKSEIRAHLKELHVLSAEALQDFRQLAKKQGLAVDVNELVEEVRGSMNSKWHQQHQFLVNLEARIIANGEPAADELDGMVNAAVAIGLSKLRTENFIANVVKRLPKNKRGDVFEELASGFFNAEQAKRTATTEQVNSSVAESKGGWGWLWFWLVIGGGFFVVDDTARSFVTDLITTGPSKPDVINAVVPTQGQTLTQQVQQELSLLGYPVGVADGIFGQKTRSAIEAFQKQKGLVVTGVVTADLLDRLEQESSGLGSSSVEPKQFRPGSLFKSCTDCPVMVVVPAGTFQMGDRSGVGQEDEKPLRSVSIPAFAMGRNEVTVGQFREFANATGYQTDAEKLGSCRADVRGQGASLEDATAMSWRDANFSGGGDKSFKLTQTDDHPVTCISYNDANAYVSWLKKKTGAAYRLPSESEWEFAARGGSTTQWWWGNAEAEQCLHANGADQRSIPGKMAWEQERRVECDDGHVFTSPVGSYKPNPFGLYDISGNVYELVQDCRNQTYLGLPGNGSPWMSGDCSQHGIRGGSWDDKSDNLRSANRGVMLTAARSNFVGFRLALDL